MFCDVTLCRRHRSARARRLGRPSCRPTMNGRAATPPTPGSRRHGVLRSASGVPVQMILTANPGGAGHLIRDRYRLHPFPARPTPDPAHAADGALQKMAVIPSRPTDNKLLLVRDPGYVDSLDLVGSAEWCGRGWKATGRRSRVPFSMAGRSDGTSSDRSRCPITGSDPWIDVCRAVQRRLEYRRWQRIRRREDGGQNSHAATAMAATTEAPAMVPTDWGAKRQRDAAD
jgi:hypothetical protein